MSTPSSPSASRIGVRSRPLSKEAWAKIIEAYMAGATAAALARAHGVAVQSIYARVKGKGKRKRANGEWGVGNGGGSREKGPRVFRPACVGDAGAGVDRGSAGETPAVQGAVREEKEAGLKTRGPLAARTACVGDAGAGVDRGSAGETPAVQGAAPEEKEAGLKTRGPLAALVDGGERVAAFLAAHQGVRTRRSHAAELWRQMRRDYEEGGFTAPVIAAWYGATHHAVKRRARVERWSKLVRAPAPAPLYPLPNADEIVRSAAGTFQSKWLEIAHAAQLPPDGAWSTWLFQGGRGAGKTRAGAEWLAERAEAKPGLYALIGPTQHDVREVMVDGPSGLRSLPGRERPWYERSRRRLLWANGSIAYAFSAEEPERLRGPQFEAAWADEFCIWPRPSETLAILRMGLRLGEAPQLVVTTTPKPIPALRVLRAESSCVLTQAATAANAAHLAPSFLEGLGQLYGGTRLAEQELEGRLLDGDGALWSRRDIERAQGGVAPERCERVVVGVDPPAGAGGAACGIVVAGRVGANAYVLADRSALGLSPLGWAMRAAEAAAEFGAEEIVAEANQGGDMVRSVLAQAGAPCAVRLVHASRGKRTRAEPVAALYEQGRVSHCAPFPALEEELLALGVSESEGLLDRADALVWALSALMTGEGPRVRGFDYKLPARGITGGRLWP